MTDAIFRLCRGEGATRAAGRAFGERLAPGALVALEGGLGAGKTVFVRGLAEGLGHDPDAVTSPSFVLAVEHPGGRTALLHVDLYRLAAGAGVEDLGIDEALERGWVVAIEWGERLPPALRRKAWRVVLGPAPEDGEDARALTILAPT
jgi:tRNA threonylcarbamoyladenosine biosynthesis protein TsaE